jgi:peptidyl-prolyl cis-trans isomerase SurA
MTAKPQGLLVIIVCACLVQLLAGAGYGEVVDRIVAEVNDEIITMSELEQMAKTMAPEMGKSIRPQEAKELQRQLLDALIDRKLARAEAKKRGITISDKELDQAIEQFRKRNNLPDGEALNKALAQAGLTMKELREQISDQIQQERILAVAVGAKISVSETEVRKVYDETFKGGGGTQTQVHLRVIQLPVPPNATLAQKEEVAKKAEVILKEARQGTPMAELGKKHGVREGDLGFINQSDVNPQLLELINKAKQGDVVPVQTPGGFQLVQLVGRRTGGSAAPRSFEDAAPEIRQALMRKEMEKRFTEWVKTLREKAHIKTML